MESNSDIRRMPRLLTTEEIIPFAKFISRIEASEIETIDRRPTSMESHWKLSQFDNGIALGKNDFLLICETAIKYEDSELVVTEVDLSSKQRSWYACPIEYYQFKYTLAENNESYSSYDAFVTGKSTKWIAILRGLVNGFIIDFEEFSSEEPGSN